MASGYNEELVIDNAGRVESTSTGSNCILIDNDLSPPFALEVENPEIVQISQPFATKNHHVRVCQLSNVIGAFPRGSFVLLGNYLSPYFGFPVEDTDSIESLFIGSSSTEDDDLVSGRVIVDGAVRTKRRSLSSGDDLLPGLLSGMISPEVVHVVGV